MKTTSSLSYKNTGVTRVTPVVSPVSPPALDLAAKNGIEGDAFARIGLQPTVSHAAIPDKAYRVLGLIGAFSWKRDAPLSFEEIGNCVGCSARSAKRHIATLEDQKLIRVLRGHNRRNEYRLVLPKKAKALTGRCECNGSLPVDKAGKCAICRKKIRAEREVAEFLKAKGPSPLEYVFLGLKARGSKSSPKDIELAHLKLSAIQEVA